ncbi:MAG TPA: hypothetical protein VM682_07335, partial [Bacillus sp. (in: firmicutes)]|nr:hypothetical protein [Bacillus sp. (in: firmicutes)]
FVHLEWVLQKLRDANLKCITDKVHLLLSQIKALGYIVNRQGITTNKAVVEDLVKFPAPRNQSGVRSFLGLAGSYEKFIENFRIIAEPLYMLLRKDVDFSWGEIQNKAFEIIKSKLASAPVLIHFDWTKAVSKNGRIFRRCRHCFATAIRRTTMASSSFC